MGKKEYDLKYTVSEREREREETISKLKLQDLCWLIIIMVSRLEELLHESVYVWLNFIFSCCCVINKIVHGYARMA